MYNLIGKKFGKLTVVEDAGHDIRKEKMWKCLCECGNYHTIYGYSLRSGKTDNCGCNKSTKISEGLKTHGMTHTRLYRIWTNMKTRCYNPKCEFFKGYGGKGIALCDEWKNFSAFYTWAITNGYTDKLSIDRVDNIYGYCPDNCRWVDMKMQQNNRTNNRLLNINGCIDTMANFSRMYKTPYYLIQRRLKNGWSDRDSVLGRS